MNRVRWHRMVAATMVLSAGVMGIGASWTALVCFLAAATMLMWAWE